MLRGPGRATETDLGILMRMGMDNVPFVGKLGGVLETSSSLLRAERMGSPWALRAGVGDILAGTVLLSGLGSSGYVVCALETRRSCYWTTGPTSQLEMSRQADKSWASKVLGRCLEEKVVLCRKER